MSVKQTIVLGVLAVAALSGCATGTTPYATNTRTSGDFAAQASPRLDTQGADICVDNGGWYDRAANACDESAP